MKKIDFWKTNQEPFQTYNYIPSLKQSDWMIEVMVKKKSSIYINNSIYFSEIKIWKKLSAYTL